jgi:hypothetical protein
MGMMGLLKDISLWGRRYIWKDFTGAPCNIVPVFNIKGSSEKKAGKD